MRYLVFDTDCFTMQIAADNAIFGQTGPKVGSFDAGYGSSQMVRLIGEKMPCYMPCYIQLFIRK